MTKPQIPSSQHHLLPQQTSHLSSSLPTSSSLPLYLATTTAPLTPIHPLGSQRRRSSTTSLDDRNSTLLEVIETVLDIVNDDITNYPFQSTSSDKGRGDNSAACFDSSSSTTVHPRQ